MLSSSCIVCGHPVDVPWLENCLDLYLRTSFRVDYKACRHCGLVQQVPLPRDTDSFYPDYPIHQQRKIVYEIARAILHRQIYLRPTADIKNGRLLDFGCGDGSYLQSIQSHVGQVFGFEPNPSVATLTSVRLNIPIFHDVHAVATELANSIDCITAHFVLEHVLDLHKTFALFADVLKPGGMLHVVVPNIRSWEARLFGRKWHGLDAPRHISFPDKASLKLLAEQHGLQLEQIRPAVFPNTLAASLASLSGHYQHKLFLMIIPLSFVLSCLAPNGTRVFVMQKSLKTNGVFTKEINK